MLGLEAVHLAGRNNPIYLEGTLPIADQDAREIGLREGQVVRGIVETRGDTLNLVINGRSFELPANLRIPRGLVQWFQIIANGKNLALKAVSAPNEKSNKAIGQQSTISPRTASLMLRGPQTSSLNQLFQPGRLETLLNGTNARNFLGQFYAMQLSAGKLDSTNLRQAVFQSGFWTEAMLSNGKRPGQLDTKQWLRQMIRILPTGTEALLALERGLEDLEAAQIDTLQAQVQRELSFSLVLPFSDSEPVEMAFYRRAPQGDDDKPPFTVNMHTVSNDLGEVWLKTSVTGKTSVDLIMWAIRPEVAAMAKAESSELGKDLKASGLEMKSFVVFNSPRPDIPDRWTSPGSVLSVEA